MWDMRMHLTGFSEMPIREASKKGHINVKIILFLAAIDSLARLSIGPKDKEPCRKGRL